MINSIILSIRRDWSEGGMNSPSSINKNTKEIPSDLRAFLNFSNSTCDKGSLKAFIADMDAAMRRMLDMPIKEVYSDDLTKPIGFELFEHYRVIKVGKSELQLMINNGKYTGSAEGFKNYNYAYTHEQRIRAEQRVRGFRWIFDVELSGKGKFFNSHLWDKKWKVSKLRYIDLAVYIQIATFFNVLDYLDHGVLLEIEDFRYCKLDDSSSLSSTTLAFLDIQRIWLESTSLNVQRYSYRDWDASIHCLIKNKLKKLCNARWKKWFGYQNPKTRLSDYIYFMERYAPKLKSIEKIEKYSKAQAFYLFFIDEQVESFDDLNYFSHEKQITSFENCGNNFSFPQKATLKHFNQLSQKFIESWFDPINVNDFSIVINDNEDMPEVDYSEALKNQCARKNSKIKAHWVALMYWLTYGEKWQQCEKTPDILLSILNRLGVDDVKEFGEELAQCFDFIVYYSEQLKVSYEDSKTKLSMDYYSGELSLNDANRQLNIKNGEQWKMMIEVEDFICSKNDNHLENAHKIDKTTTVKSIKRKIKEWHEELALRNLEAVSKKNELITYDHVNMGEEKQGESIFTPIRTKHEIMCEGISKHNCVSTFHDRVLSGSYLVCRVLRGEESATLGIKILENNESKYALDQCYGAYNSIVSSELLADAVKYIKKLNNER